MNIAIIGGSEAKRAELEQMILSNSNRSKAYSIVCYEFIEDEQIYVNSKVSVAFIFVENSKILHRIKEFIDGNEKVSIVVVSNRPEYALESIRLNIKYYLLYPLEQYEVLEALKRSEVVL